MFWAQGLTHQKQLGSCVSIFLLDRVSRITRHHRMRPRMIANFMTFGDHPLDDMRAIGRCTTYNIKRRLEPPAQPRYPTTLVCTVDRDHRQMSKPDSVDLFLSRHRCLNPVRYLTAQRKRQMHYVGYRMGNATDQCPSTETTAPVTKRRRSTHRLFLSIWDYLRSVSAGHLNNCTLVPYSVSVKVMRRPSGDTAALYCPIYSSPSAPQENLPTNPLEV